MSRPEHAAAAPLRAFQVSPAILRSLIEHQATTLPRALAEAVMNALDAGADEIEIDVTSEQLCIRDNGRGLKTTEEIESYFAVFGFDHTTTEEAGTRQYGQFGMGRGQLFNFGVVTWRTGRHRLVVDLRTHDLAYQHEVLAGDVPGLEVTCALYHPLDSRELADTLSDIRRQFRLTRSARVSLNGKPVYRPVKWDTQDELACYRVGNHGELHIYNAEVLVQVLHTGDGIIQTLTPQATNLTRTELLAEIQHTLTSRLKAQHRERLKRQIKLTEADCRELIDLLRGEYLKPGTPERDLLHTHPLVRDTTGREYTFEQFLSSAGRIGLITVRGDDPVYADKVHQHRLAFVLDPQTLRRWGLNTWDEWLNVLNHIVELQWTQYDIINRAPLRFILSIRRAVPCLPEGDDLIDPAELGAAEQAVLDFLGRVYHYAARAASYTSPDPQERTTFRQHRVLRAGRSATAQGWTDGRSYIALNIEEVRAATRRTGGGFNGFCALTRLYFVMLHELCHTERSSTALHDVTFYKHYHDASQANASLAAQRQLALEYPRLEQRLKKIRLAHKEARHKKGKA